MSDMEVADDNNETDSGSAEDQSASSVEDSYLRILDAVQACDPLSDLLAATQRGRSARLLNLYLHTPALPGLNAAFLILDQLTVETTSSGIERLLRRAQSEIPRVIEAIVSDDYVSSSNSSRLLMEIEVLFREWAFAPSQIAKWEAATEKERNRIFSFGKTLDRVRVHEGVADSLKLPESHEYSFHSTYLHPTMVEEPEEAQDVALYADEICGHLDQVIKSAINLFETHPEIVGVTKGDHTGTGKVWNSFLLWREEAQTRRNAWLTTQGLYLEPRAPRTKDWDPKDLIKRLPPH